MSQSQELSELQSHNSQLREEVKILKTRIGVMQQQHEQTLEQLSDLKQSEQKYRNLNDMLVNNLKRSDPNISKQNITLNLEGEFLTMRVKELQLELEKYRNGVSDSVDRRVKKIVEEYAENQDLENERRKSRFSVRPPSQISNHSHNHTYYNIEYKTTAERPLEKDQTSNFKKDKGIKYEMDVISSIQSDQKNQNYEINIHGELGSCQECQNLNQQIERKNLYIEELQAKLQKLNLYLQDFISKKGLEVNELLRDKEGLLRKIEMLEEEIECIDGSGNVCIHKRANNTTRKQWEAKLVQKEQNWQQKYNELLGMYQDLEELSHSESHSKYSQVEPYSVSRLQRVQQMRKNGQFLGDSSSQITQQYADLEENSQNYGLQKAKQERMLQEISNLMNCIGQNKKNHSNKTHQNNAHIYQASQENRQTSRVSYGASRVHQQKRQTNSKLDGSVFTIKEGVNRHGSNSGILY